MEALLKKHEDFEKSLSAQEEKITVSDQPSTFTDVLQEEVELTVNLWLLFRLWMNLPPN